MNSLEEWYWKLEECSDDSSRKNLLEVVRATDSNAALALEKMLEMQHDSCSFMNFREASGQRAVSQVLQEFYANNAKHWQSSPRRIPKEIGPYKMLEQIGEGGMGVVFLGQQTKPVRRKVAIKLIKPGMDSRQVIARFEAERQALAMMDHPNIAKIFDAGTTVSGLPYFVMELVRGIPITDYCDLAQMKVEQRLELFKNACQAIQHAHNKGMIHRDLKPSNVLVTEHDGTPVVKIIDFGVAKALTGDLTEKTLCTGIFQMVGTPSYMSPEQASLSNLDVDTRSDVYSLGVLLYELVSGSLPLEKESIKEMNFERLRHHICNTEPTRPSKRLTTAKDQAEIIARTRGIQASQLAKSIHHELDWIVMRAIEKDRNRRYQSPRDLASDISRFLSGKTVEACPPTLAYRARKVFRRYRNSIAVVVIILTCLNAATLISLNQAWKATKALELATRNQNLAEAKTAELSEFVYSEDMIAASEHFFDGNQEEFERILQRHGSPDKAQLRGFEWPLLQSLKPIATKTVLQSKGKLHDFVVDQTSGRAVIGDSLGRLYGIDLETRVQFDLNESNGDSINAIELSPNGPLAYVNDAGELVLHCWEQSADIDTQTNILKLSQAVCLSLTSTDQTLWIGDNEGKVFKYDLQQGTTQRRTEWALRRPIQDLAVIPGKAILASHGHEVFELQLDYSEPAQRPPWRIALNPSLRNVRAMAVHPPSGLLVCAQALGRVSLFRVTGEKPQQIFTHLLPDYLHSVNISPDGKWIAAGDAAGRIHLLPTHGRYASSFLDAAAARKRQLKSWRAHEGKIEHVAFHLPKNGNAMAILSAGRDGRFVVSQPFDSSPVQFLPVEDYVVHYPTQSANCHLLWQHVLGNLELDDPRFRDGRVGGRPVAVAMRFQDKSQAELYVVIDDRTLVKMPKTRADDGEVLWQADNESRANRFAVSSDGSHFAICRERRNPRRHFIEVYLAGASFPKHILPSNLANDMDFSPDGKTLAYVWNNDIAVLDVVTGEQLQLLQFHIDSIQDIAFSPDGTHMATVSSDSRLAVWDTASGQLMWSQLAHQNGAKSVAFHPTLPTLATVGGDNYVRFWSTREKVADDSVRLVGKFPLSVGNGASIAFSADGKSLFVHHAELGVSALRTESSP